MFKAIFLFQDTERRKHSDEAISSSIMLYDGILTSKSEFAEAMKYSYCLNCEDQSNYIFFFRKHYSEWENGIVPVFDGNQSDYDVDNKDDGETIDDNDEDDDYEPCCNYAANRCTVLKYLIYSNQFLSVLCIAKQCGYVSLVTDEGYRSPYFYYNIYVHLNLNQALGLITEDANIPYTKQLTRFISDYIIEMNDCTYNDFTTQAFLRHYFSENYRLKDVNSFKSLTRNLFRVIFQIGAYYKECGEDIDWFDRLNYIFITHIFYENFHSRKNFYSRKNANKHSKKRELLLS